MLNINSKAKLNNGTGIPLIGLGVWKLAEGEEVENAVKYAFDAGYRHIDTAKIYENEAGVGRAIKNSGLPREDVFVTTKLWNEDQGYESALKAIDMSLERLGLEYVDLYLVHWPAASDIWAGEAVVNKREETWKAMEEIYGSGKAKAIGVSNYTIKHLGEMKGYAKTRAMVDQVEFNPLLFQKELLAYCRENSIVLEAYSPLFHGERLDKEEISVFAKKYDKSNAQILIRWSLQHGCVVLPKSAHKDRIVQNISVFDFEISAEDMEKIDALNQDLHLRWDPSTIE